MKIFTKGKIATPFYIKILAKDLLEHSSKNFQIYVPLPKETR